MDFELLNIDRLLSFPMSETLDWGNYFWLLWSFQDINAVNSGTIGYRIAQGFSGSARVGFWPLGTASPCCSSAFLVCPVLVPSSTLPQEVLIFSALFPILYFFNLCFNLYYFFPLVALGLVCSCSSSLRYKITYLICDLSSFLMYAFTVINCINCMYSYKLPAFIVPHNFWHVVFSFFLSQGVF